MSPKEYFKTIKIILKILVIHVAMILHRMSFLMFCLLSLGRLSRSFGGVV